MKIIKSIFLNILLVIISIIIALTLIEVILRFTSYKNIGKRNYSIPAYHFKADEILGYDIAQNSKEDIHELFEYPYKLFSNQYGCFDYEREIPEDYGLIVGDSFTWGYAPLEKKWTTYLEEKSAIFMLKCGVIGFGTKQELIKGKRIVKQIGKNPKYIVVLYVSNDLNDDFFFPSKTVISGNLVGKLKNVDLINGKKYFYTEEELKKKYKKHVKNSIQNKLRSFRYSLVSYRLYIYIKPGIKEAKKDLLNWLSGNNKLKEINKAKNKAKNKITQEATQDNEFPKAIKKNSYAISLISYIDKYDKKWYNELINQHNENIRNFIDFSNSLNAKLLFIDMEGVLNHKRFNDAMKYFDLNDNAYYYNLKKDYPKQSLWKYDGHWNIEGNQEAGKFIYQHFKEIGIFK